LQADGYKRSGIVPCDGLLLPPRRKPKLTAHQIAEAKARREAGEGMESPDDYTHWIERAARRLEQHIRADDVLQAEEQMQFIEKTLKVLRLKFAEHLRMVG